MSRFLFTSIHDQQRSRAIEAEKRVVELLSEQSRIKSRLEYDELVLRAIEAALHRDTALADIQALIEEHQTKFPEAWFR